MTNLNLLNVKKIGVSIFENDLTLEDNQFDGPLREERLIVGFSRVGVFNKVVRITSQEDRIRYFGQIDTFLESRGSFFHRFIDIALLEGPVLALNLLPLNNTSDGTGDEVEYQSFSTSPKEINPTKIKELYSSFYSKERFWNPSKENFVSIVDSNVASKDSILNFVNLSKNKVSLLIKKSTTQSEFNIYAHEYYGGIDNVPHYISPFDKMSDYFVDVKVISGDFTNYSNLSTDPIYSKYFTSSGLKSSSVVSLEGSSDFNTLLSVTGCILPNIADGRGINYSIDSIINSRQISTGIFCVINEEYLNSLTEDDHYLIDMLGHSLVNENFSINSVDFLSYKFNLLENLLYAQKTSFTSDSVALSSSDSYQNSFGAGENGLFSNRLTITGLEVQNSIIPKKSLVELNDGKYAVVNNYITSGSNTIISYSHPDKASEGLFYYSITAVNSGTDTITINGIHRDLAYDMTGEHIFVTDGTSKYYFEIASYTLNTGDNLTNIVVEDPLNNLTKINTTYKVTWGAGYQVIAADDDTNKITIKGAFDFDDIDSNLTDSKMYLKCNDQKTVEIVFSESNVNSSGNTELTLTAADVIFKNNTTADFLALNKLGELLESPHYLTFGFRSITRPKVTTNNINLIYTPDVVRISSGKVYAYKYSNVFKDWESGILVSGDIYYKEITGPSVKPYYIGISHVVDSNNIEVLEITNYIDSALTLKDSELMIFGNKKRLSNGTYETVNNTDIVFSSKIGNINEKIQVHSTFDNETRIRLTSENGDKIQVGNLISSLFVENGKSTNYLSPVISKKKIIISNVTYFDITLPRSAKIYIESGNYFIEKYLPFDSFVDSYNLKSLSGFTLGEYHLPGNNMNKLSQLEKILGVIENTNLKETLSDKNLIDYRYIVDTFESLITNELYPKTILSRLAENQARCFAFLNTPSIEAFSKSTDPIFSSSVNQKVFEASYLPTGGNLEFGPSLIYSHPTEINGAKYSTGVGPHLTYLKTNGQKIKIPAAAHVSNLFVRKNKNGEQFKIAAGTSRGFLGDPRVLDVEYISENDLSYFLDIGYNPIINKPGYGIIFYGNRTNYLKDSSLSNLHVRDMLGTVERLIENILQRYIFNLNTPKTRFEVYEDLVNLLFPLKGEAFYDFSIRVDNKQDNQLILNNSIGFVAIDIYPVSYIEKFLNVLNIKKGVGIEPSGFQI